MIQRLSTHEAAALLLKDESAAWTHSGALALVEYLEECEEEETPIEFDRVLIRCDYSEYSSAIEAAREYGNDYSVNIYDENDNEKDEEEAIAELEAYCLEWLQERTTTLAFDGGVIIQNF